MLFLILVTMESKGWKFLFYYESREVHKNKTKQKKMLIKFKWTKQKSLKEWVSRGAHKHHKTKKISKA